MWQLIRSRTAKEIGGKGKEVEGGRVFLSFQKKKKSFVGFFGGGGIYIFKAPKTT